MAFPVVAGEVVNLNVGGCIYTTSRSTLTRYPDSLLGSMFSDRLPTNVDDGNRYIIDRDGPTFRHILNFLRQSKLILPDGFQEWDILSAEADYYYYQIQELIQIINETRQSATAYEFMEVEYNPSGHILNFLRRSKLILPDGFQEWDILSAEADYYQLQGLNQLINETRKRIRQSDNQDQPNTYEFVEVYLYQGRLDKGLRIVCKPKLIEQSLATTLTHLMELSTGDDEYVSLCDTSMAEYFGYSVRLKSAKKEGSLELNRLKLFRDITNCGFTLISTSSVPLRPNDDDNGPNFKIRDKWTFSRKEDQCSAAACHQLNRYIIDGDGPTFRHILNFLRRSKLILPDGFKEWNILSAEADYYNYKSSFNLSTKNVFHSPIPTNMWK
ncbi:BTB/POZ domain-containing protein KCTD6-like [Anneissia japonica]|uniref:BTB/POZ domain-containing protein KCTD6-like n=1 Tax=Anneissia japonica TaxID=1529436 RepID=UPI0014254E5E|nr:BTB/POZ domain-containing protein KCTD6-like [Anneissia japonica]